MSEVKIKFEPEGKTVSVQEGAPLSRAVLRAGITLDMPCGGQGGCGKCRVQIVDKAPEPTESDRAALSGADLAAGFRLACQTIVKHPMTVEVPKTSLLADSAHILGSAGSVHEAGEALDPPVEKKHVEFDKPVLSDEAADLERMKRRLGDFEVDLELLRELPHKLRSYDFKGTAVLSEGRLIDFEEGNTESTCCSVAFDIGTTTLVGVLIDLTTGREIASASKMNPQTRFGDDVLSRVQRVREDEDGLAEMHQNIMDAINLMIADMCREAGVSRKHVYEAAFSGNTTMQHLLLGVSPAALGEAPFAPAMRDKIVAPAAQAGLRIHPRGRLLAMPIIGGFVGGDTVSGILVTKLSQADAPSLLVDIGTNGELALKHEQKLLSASCAAGPAFEGATLTSGMRATIGAIEEVVLDGDLRYKVIGGTKPSGLCGSALIDLVAELLRRGILMPQGLLLTGEDLPSDLEPALRERVIDGEGGPEFVVASEEESATGRKIVLTYRDLRALQLATGAVRAGIGVLLRQAGLAPEDLDRVYVAGAFGNYIRPRNAQRMGLLPHRIPLSRIVFAGNTSLAGARHAATSRGIRAAIDELARMTLHVELSQDPSFSNEYMEAMLFPEQEAPSV